MRRIKRFAALFLVLAQLFCLCACSGEKNEESKRDWEVASEMNEAYGSEIQAKCQEFFDENSLRGLAVAVFDNGKGSFLNYGLTKEGGEVITEHTQFEIASVTKTFTSLLMAQMAADPEIKLDIHAEADDYLPFALPTMAGKKVELWHLSTHTSGLARMPSNYQENFNPYKDYDMEKLTTYFETDATLLAQPGDQYGYSNLAVGTLGVALTQAAGMEYDSGKGFESLLKERILDPLDLKETAIYLSEEGTAAMAQPHTAMGTPYPIWDFDALAACGALKSTTYDLAQYIAAAMGQTACDETIATAFDECCKLHYSGGGNTMGLGFHVMKVGGGYTCYWHNGATGGSRSIIITCEKTGQGVAVLCNNAVSVDGLGVAIMEAMLKADA